MNWVRKCNLLAIEAIKFNSLPYNHLNNLWDILYQSYNSAQNYPIDSHILDEIPLCHQTKQSPFYITKLKDTVNKCSSSSISGPDHVLWIHLKEILNNNKCCSNFVNIVNTYINFSYQFTHFKKPMSIIIPKPNKPSYNTLKAFCLIILLNILEKLIKKVISSRLQIHTIVSNFIYPSQLEGIKQCSTTDARIFLTHLIYIRQVKSLYISTLVLNISQFFPSLNHHLLLMILTKAGFNSNISLFFSNYLINKQT